MCLLTSVSVGVLVEQSDAVTQISGGVVQPVRVGGTLTLTAYLSFDGDASTPITDPTAAPSTALTLRLRP